MGHPPFPVPGDTAGDLTGDLTVDAAQRSVLMLPSAASGVVVGAPGTGKTRTIVDRVARLVADGMPPEALLVLTPTRQAATSLRDRLALAVGVATTGPLARSVAAFAYQLVRAEAVRTAAEPPQLLTGPDEDQLVADLLAGDAEDEEAGPSRWPEWLPAEVRATRGFRTEVRAFLAECTTLGIEPAGLAARAAAEERPVWASMASFAREYHRVRADMRGAHRDAAGLVREAVGLVRQGEAAQGAFAQLRAVLVDDAQELTLGGVELLEACRARGVAVLAFGDPDVGSGAFRGATPENFARLAASGPVHVLPAVHRGTAPQRDLTAEVTSRIGAAGIVAHRQRPTAAAPDGTVRALALRSPAEEHDAIARLLRERHVHGGVPWSECVVIAHDTRQVLTLEAELAAREVPTRATGQGAPLAGARAVRDLLRIVLLAARESAEWTNDEVGDALRGAGLDPVELRRLRTALRHQTLRQAAEEDGVPGAAEPTGAALLASALAHPAEFALVDTREARRAARIGTAIAALRAQLAAEATAHELLWTAWESLDGQRTWQAAAAGHGPLAEQAGRELDAVVALFQAAKRHGERADGTAPLTFLRGILDSDVAEDRLGGPAPDGVVQVLTPAAALGTEFDTVVVAGVQDGVWPNLRARGSLLETWRLSASGDADAVDRRRGVLHDELRLFARAISRARSLLVITAVDDDDTGPSALFELLPPADGVGPEHPLSLRGLVAQHRRLLTEPRASSAAQAHAAGQLALLAAAGVSGADPAEWFGIRPPTSTAPLRDLEREDVRVSPSRLHTLDECELNWVIGDLGGDSGGAVAGLGTIVHAALEHAEGIDEESLWAVVEARWGELDFESAWRDRAERTRARDLVRRLAVYLRRFEASGGRLLGVEPHFEIPIPVDEGAPHGAILSGYIDRVELTGDGDVVIVDLKTGKREPQTDEKVGDHPQLAAYQLAFESGAIPEAAGHPGGGAKLLVLRPTATKKDYAEPRQAPFTDETRAAFLGRVQDAVRVMRGTTFAAPYEEHCRDDHSYGLCRIHTIGAVSSS